MSFTYWLVLWSELKKWPQKAYSVPHQWFHLGLKDSKQAALGHTTKQQLLPEVWSSGPWSQRRFLRLALRPLHARGVMAARVATEVGRDWKGSFSALPSPRLTLCLPGSLTRHVCQTTPLLEELQLQEFKYIVLKPGATGEFSIAGTSYTMCHNALWFREWCCDEIKPWFESPDVSLQL